MESVLRRLGLKKGEGRETEARRQLQKELFAFSDCGSRGFPSKPSSLAFDRQLSLLAVGTRTGAVTIFGRPGVYFRGQHKDDVEVTKMCFLPEQARLITLCSDNSLHLWEYNEKANGTTSLDEVKSFAIENSKLKMVSSWCLTDNVEFLVLGTDGGHVHFFDIASFTMSDKVLYQDVIIQNAPDDFKVSPGSIEVVLQHPSDMHKFLIGYSRGIIVLWNVTDNKADNTYSASQQLESIAFGRKGAEFTTAHSDGSYVTWATDGNGRLKDNPTTLYGPFPCKAITALELKDGKTEPWTVFVGGMPRANYGDKHTVTVIHGQTHVVFDFVSRVVDFLVLSSNEDVAEPHTLFVLTEEELVAVDLSTDGWPTHRLPYLANVDARSPVTCIKSVSDFSESLWNTIGTVGGSQFSHCTAREWPVTGGELKQTVAKNQSAILTGHADGSVCFWDVSLAGGLSLLYTLNTADVFALETLSVPAVGAPAEEEWPPFRKVGIRRVLIDEPRLAVRNIDFCASTDMLMVGGASGQVTVFKVGGTEGEHKVEQYVVDIVADSEGFGWHGPEGLAVKSEPVAVAAGFQPAFVVQMHPATKCTTLAHHSTGQLLAVATEQGIGVFDMVRLKTVYVNSVAASSGLKMSRSRSFQRTLRDSFRQLRRNRSESDNKLDHKTTEQPATEAGDKQEQKPEATEKPDAETVAETGTHKEEKVDETKKDEEIVEKSVESPEKVDKIEKIETEEPLKPVAETEEKVEEKGDIEIIPTTDEERKQEPTKEDAKVEPESPNKVTKPALVKENVTMMATVNSLSFADTVLLQGHASSVTLWVGTVAGHILIFQLTVPEADKRQDEDVKCVLAKEIHLKHGAPVIATFVIDRSSHPLTDGLKATETDSQHTGHRVVVCTQQQVKIFNLPTLKPHHKYKLHQHGDAESHITDAMFGHFVSKSDESYSEPDLVCLTDKGKLHVLTVPQLRLQIQTNALLKTEDDSAVSLGALTSRGGVYYRSGSELKEFTTSAHAAVSRAVVPLKEGMRPVPEPEPIAVEEPVKEAEGEKETKTEETVETSPVEKTVVPIVSDDGDKQINESVVSVNNDSMAAGDITADSIKVHVSEEPAMVVAEGDVTSHKVVEKMVHSVKTVGGVTEESKTTTIEEMKKVEGMMSSCTVTSSSSSSTKVEGEGSTTVTSSTVTTVEG